MDAKNDTGAIAIKPPAPDGVLYFIYQKDGDGAVSYEIANGAWATYWYGHSFELDGKRYFTGFAYATQERFPADGEHVPGPDDQVDLSNATFLLTDEGSETPWSLVGAEPYIGRFGAHDKGNEVDPGRKAQEFRTREGRLLLAVPTSSLQSGVRIESFDLFVFNPAKEVPIDEHHWTYVGNVYIGEDNSASCDQDAGRLACANSSGTLQFVPQDDSPMPMLRVERNGTVVDGPGQTRTLGSSDVLEYSFDAANRKYLTDDL
ncbi:hypothetical protein [Marilutibacter alkalisoli]|uniref:Uncharacterized protein n=1 Tax=Marilutibacter alkalisoli TaxID=2591633 RepID=A0A514BVA5_9GAMM|nr:hypothetical protein [Lysobacter alkalisoli]QDH71338.1 hypothetical protein FKV23_15510 [Lysobacter alkalisoli]